MVIHGTSNFVSKHAAVKYYGHIKTVESKILEGAIVIGAPAIKKGETLVLLDGKTRYGIGEKELTTSPVPCTGKQEIRVKPKPKIVKFEDMSKDAQETAIGMMEYCLDNHKAMGMDDGFTRAGNKKQFRKEIEQFVKENGENHGTKNGN